MSRSEKKVAERLKALAIECYLPKKRTVRQWSDRKKTVVEPLISGYVFVKVDAAQRDSVLQVNGVLNYLRYNKQDAVLRDKEIEILKMVELKGYHIERESTDNLAVGGAVEIKAGPFKGMIGIVQVSNNKSTYSLIIEQMELSFKIHVPGDIILPFDKDEGHKEIEGHTK